MLSNYRYNAIGGIDADRLLESNEVVPYTLTSDEVLSIDGEISGSQELAVEELNAKIQLSDFKANRQQALSTATVDANGFMFDADELSIGRMANAIIALTGQADDYVIQWSLADTSTGVMSDVTLADLKLAHLLAVQNMSAIWGV